MGRKNKKKKERRRSQKAANDAVSLKEELEVPPVVNEDAKQSTPAASGAEELVAGSKPLTKEHGDDDTNDGNTSAEEELGDAPIHRIVCRPSHLPPRGAPLCHASDYVDSESVPSMRFRLRFAGGKEAEVSVRHGDNLAQLADRVRLAMNVKEPSFAKTFVRTLLNLIAERNATATTSSTSSHETENRHVNTGSK